MDVEPISGEPPPEYEVSSQEDKRLLEEARSSVLKREAKFMFERLKKLATPQGLSLTVAESTVDTVNKAVYNEFLWLKKLKSGWDVPDEEVPF